MGSFPCLCQKQWGPIHRVFTTCPNVEPAQSVNQIACVPIWQTHRNETQNGIPFKSHPPKPNYVFQKEAQTHWTVYVLNSNSNADHLRILHTFTYVSKAPFVLQDRPFSIWLIRNVTFETKVEEKAFGAKTIYYSSFSSPLLLQMCPGLTTQRLENAIQAAGPDGFVACF